MGTFKPPSLNLDALLWPAGAVAVSMDLRSATLANSAVLSSGRLGVWGVPLYQGTPVSSVTFHSATTALATGVNQWACILDASRALRAVSASAGAAAWGSNTAKTFTWSTWVAPATAVYYVGLMVQATTVPTLWGRTSGNAVNNNAAPYLAASSTTGLTTPPTAPWTGAAFTAQLLRPWFWLG